MIRGNAINNDGAGKVGFTAPSVDGQAAAIAQAVGGGRGRPAHHQLRRGARHRHRARRPDRGRRADRGVRPRTPTSGGWCGIGSVKSNIGHLSQRGRHRRGDQGGAGAGARADPADACNYETPNPAIDFADTPFYVANTPDQVGAPTAGRAGPGSARSASAAPTRTWCWRRRRRRTGPTGRSARRTCCGCRRAPRRRWTPPSRGSPTTWTAPPTAADARRRRAHPAGRPAASTPHRARWSPRDAAEAAAALRDRKRRRQRHRRPAAPGGVPVLRPGLPVRRDGRRSCTRERAGVRRRRGRVRRAAPPRAGPGPARPDPRPRPRGGARSCTETRYTQPALFTVEYALAAAVAARRGDTRRR